MASRYPFSRSLRPGFIMISERESPSVVKEESFKSQISESGFATCPEGNCRLSFLSLAGIVAHTKNCSGFVSKGNFVSCGSCDARFSQFKSLQTHSHKNHGASPMSSEGSGNPPIKPRPPSPEQESKKELSKRIMSESRLISTPRLRGRPSKSSKSSQEVNPQASSNPDKSTELTGGSSKTYGDNVSSNLRPSFQESNSSTRDSPKKEGQLNNGESISPTLVKPLIKVYSRKSSRRSQISNPITLSEDDSNGSLQSPKITVRVNGNDTTSSEAPSDLSLITDRLAISEKAPQRKKRSANCRFNGFKSKSKIMQPSGYVTSNDKKKSVTSETSQVNKACAKKAKNSSGYILPTNFVTFSKKQRRGLTHNGNSKNKKPTKKTKRTLKSRMSNRRILRNQLNDILDNINTSTISSNEENAAHDANICQAIGRKTRSNSSGRLQDSTVKMPKKSSKKEKLKVSKPSLIPMITELSGCTDTLEERSSDLNDVSWNNILIDNKNPDSDVATRSKDLSKDVINKNTSLNDEAISSDSPMITLNDESIMPKEEINVAKILTLSAQDVSCSITEETDDKSNVEYEKILVSKNIGTERGEKNNLERVEGALPEETIESVVETPKRRGRKRKRSVSMLQDVLSVNSLTSNESSKTPMRSKPKKSSHVGMELPTKRRCGNKTKNNNVIQCGKCNASFATKNQFSRHVASSHNGMARQAGENQEFSDEEMRLSLKEAFKWTKKVTCFRCNKSSYTTYLGLQYHIKLCGKTKEEIQAKKVSCPHCDYRGLPGCLRSHLKVHTVSSQNKDDSSPADASEKDRVKIRHAASKAKERVNKAMSVYCNKEDVVEIDENDEEYKISVDVMFRDKYSEIKPNIFQCNICQAQTSNKKDMTSHIVDIHSEEISKDEEEEDNNAFRGYISNSNNKVAKDHGRWNRNYPLMPRLEYLKSELDYRQSNYAKKAEILFDSIPSNDYRIIDELKAQSYLPSSRESIFFKVKQSTDTDLCAKEIILKRFEGIIINKGAPIFYAGGPIWAVEWSPLRHNGEAFFAVSAHCEMNDISRMTRLESGMGLIQIWSGGKLITSTTEAFPPSFKYGIIHNYGKIWCFKWCPSGTDTLTHVGLLAAACSDGNVYVHRIKQPEKTPLFYQHEPELSLRPFKESFGQCTKLSWYSGEKHRVIAVGYTSGVAALFDLLSTSTLLKKGPFIYPYKVVQVHTTSISGIDLFGDGQFPRFLASGSFDRMYYIWDLQGPLIPINSGKKGLISDLHFFRPLSNAHLSISQDDAFLQSHTQTILSEPGYSKIKTQPILCQNSAIKSESLSQWLGTLAVGTSAGEVIVYVAPSRYMVLESDKYTTKRRTFIFRTEVDLEDSLKNSHEFLQFKDNIKKVVYVDMNLMDFSLNPDSEISATRAIDTLSLEDITGYPLASINRVSLNPNLHACTWILSGSQTGIGRLNNIQALKHYSFDEILSDYSRIF